MCGVAGLVSMESIKPEAEEANVSRMLNLLRHRGPDQFGIYSDRYASLGNARLSIIDVEGGQQPIGNENETLWIVLNGEIFNYIELRADLKKRGHQFATNTDTEVVLHLFEQYGPECLHQLNGQFAFAIWDSVKRRLFIARDRLGKRPLFYTTAGKTLLFASECKALLAYPGVSAELDPTALANVFQYWAPLPGRSAFRHIQELPAGHYLEYSDGRTKVEPYWDLSFPPDSETRVHREAGEYLEEFRSLLEDATAIRLRSDVPVGAYLSGGLDSSMIAEIVTRVSSRKLTTFSISFEDSDFDEREHQLRAARHLGTQHEVVHATHADIGRVFPDVIWHCEAPLTRTAPTPLFLLSKLVRDCNYKVVLSGEGADEILAGYDIFKEMAIRRFWARCPGSSLRPLLLQRLYSDIPNLGSTSLPFLSAFFRHGLSDLNSAFYSHAIRWATTARTQRFFSEHLKSAIHAENPNRELYPALPAAYPTWGPLQKAQYLESRLFLSQYLLSSQGDRVTAAHSVEARHPFLDYRVVEFCSQLPSTLKLRGLKDKYLLRRLAATTLPSDIAQRPKRPYRAPIYKAFFANPVREYVRELLSHRSLESTGYFHVGAVEQLVRKAAGGSPLSETDDMAIAGILSTQLLHHQFVAGFKTAPLLSEKDEIKFIRAARTAAVMN